MTNDFPVLSDDFFAVCQTAIKAAAWKYEDFSRVKSVEGELERLRAFLASQSATTTAEFQTPVGQIGEIKSSVVKDTTPEPIASGSTPVALNPTKNGIVTPTEAKKAPVRAMPEDIKQIVEVGIEVAKNPPRVRDVIVEELPSDPDAARVAFNKPF
jgi:hypothetical protein